VISRPLCTTTTHVTVSRKCTLLHYLIKQIAQSVINTHFSLTLSLQFSISTTSLSERYMQRHKRRAYSVKELSTHVELTFYCNCTDSYLGQNSLCLCDLYIPPWCWPVTGRNTQEEHKWQMTTYYWFAICLLRYITGYTTPRAFSKYVLPVQVSSSLLINIPFPFLSFIYSHISVKDLLDITLNLV
jgi:hypothetical protein